MDTRDRPPNSQWQEWVIGVCVALLSLFAAWIVFGEDVIHLFPQPAGPVSTAQPSPRPEAQHPGETR
jgi:hypothetical protein